MSDTPLLDELTSMGIKVRLSEDGKLRLKPKTRITPDLIKRVRADREQLAWLVRDRTEIDRIARLDAERREADRQAGRGFDFDCSAPSHADFLNRTGHSCACRLSPEEQAEREVDRLACADGWIPPTPGIALEQGRLIMGKYLREHPEELHKEAGALVGLAFYEAFLCPGD